jgi:hypothetical protein
MHTRTALDKRPADGATDPLCRARDQDHAAVKTNIHAEEPRIARREQGLSMSSCD